MSNRPHLGGDGILSLAETSTVLVIVFSRQMKLVTVVAGALVGGALATMICWGTLYVYGAFVLHGKGSLFDTNPAIANLFFVTWGGLILVFAMAGAIVATRGKSR
ncbi:hypothetical protein KDW61_00755 [Burkholderia cenocepacia]|uniref:hypothetical protein n=1 Tax=Burkholderia cenocepacia TaxID=95486 RepID=UPI001B92D745|nr:hypothetical protein [Burkholderia cenocepacia]MBR8207183.1 hypothetical protein [Burkholderia cenocepacia]